MNRIKIIATVVLALLNIALFTLCLIDVIITDNLTRCILSFVFALASVFSFGLLMNSLGNLLNEQRKRQSEQTQKPKCCFEAIIYFNHSGIRVETAGFLDHEKEYYEEYDN